VAAEGTNESGLDEIVQILMPVDELNLTRAAAFGATKLEPKRLGCWSIDHGSADSTPAGPVDAGPELPARQFEQSAH
jgi:hypothetical protein